MIIPEIYPNLNDLLIKGTVQELLIWNSQVQLSQYALNNLIKIKIALSLEEISKKGVIIVHWTKHLNIRFLYYYYYYELRSVKTNANTNIHTANAKNS